MASVSIFHPSQSSSDMPSSMEIISGNCRVQSDQNCTIFSELRSLLSDFLKMYLPLEKNSLDAGSSAIPICAPGLYPAFVIASSTTSTASWFDLQLGAKPPSSPTAVE